MNRVTNTAGETAAQHRLLHAIGVTSGGVNPTSSIQALGLYIADSIKKRLAMLFD